MSFSRCNEPAESELERLKIGKVVRSRTHRTLLSLSTEAFYNMAHLRVEPPRMIGGRNSNFWDKKVHTP